eukprot:555881-Amphidinium_carterae.1
MGGSWTGSICIVHVIGKFAGLAAYGSTAEGKQSLAILSLIEALLQRAAEDYEKMLRVQLSEFMTIERLGLNKPQHRRIGLVMLWTQSMNTGASCAFSRGSTISNINVLPEERKRTFAGRFERWTNRTATSIQAVVDKSEHTLLLGLVLASLDLMPLRSSCHPNGHGLSDYTIVLHSLYSFHLGGIMAGACRGASRGLACCNHPAGVPLETPSHVSFVRCAEGVQSLEKCLLAIVCKLCFSSCTRAMYPMVICILKGLKGVTTPITVLTSLMCLLQLGRCPLPCECGSKRERSIYRAIPLLEMAGAQERLRVQCILSSK